MNFFAYCMFCSVAGKTKRFSPNVSKLKLLFVFKFLQLQSQRLDISWVAFIVQTYYMKVSLAIDKSYRVIFLIKENHVFKPEPKLKKVSMRKNIRNWFVTEFDSLLLSLEVISVHPWSYWRRVQKWREPWVVSLLLVQRNEQNIHRRSKTHNNSCDLIK